MSSPKIAVIGAGPAGCALAKLLNLQGINVTVFESDTSPNYRGQGGTLDLHPDTGIASLKEAGLYNEFIQHSRYDGQYLAITEKNLQPLFVRRADTHKDTVGERPEIDRAKLREILIKSLPEGMIQWGCHLSRVDGGSLVFDDRTISGFDLIVGADGAWSKVRRAIDDQLVPFYTGVGYHDLLIPDAEHTAPEVYKLVNRGSVFACGEGQRFTLQQLGSGSVHIHTSFRRGSPTWMKKEECGYDTNNLDEVKEALQKEFHDWCPLIKDALSSTQELGASRSLHVLKPGLRWEHKSGLTLIGDAAHLMAPHGGEGVNQALADAASLAKAIVSSVNGGKNLDEQIGAFESAMMTRVEPVQRMSNDNCQDWMFTPGAPQTVLTKTMTRHVNMELRPMFHPLGAAGVRLYFLWLRLSSFIRGLFGY